VEVSQKKLAKSKPDNLAMKKFSDSEEEHMKEEQNRQDLYESYSIFKR